METKREDENLSWIFILMFFYNSNKKHVKVVS